MPKQHMQAASLKFVVRCMCKRSPHLHALAAPDPKKSFLKQKFLLLLSGLQILQAAVSNNSPPMQLMSCTCTVIETGLMIEVEDADTSGDC